MLSLNFNHFINLDKVYGILYGDYRGKPNYRQLLPVGDDAATTRDVNAENKLQKAIVDKCRGIKGAPLDFSAGTYMALLHFDDKNAAECWGSDC